MQNIQVNDIPDDGMTVDLSSRDRPWLAGAVAAVLRERWEQDDEARLHLTLARIGHQIDLVGGLYVHRHQVCDRCLTEFVGDQQIPIHLLLVPTGGRFDVDDSGQTAEPGDEDISFGTYQGRAIDLATIISEHTLLEQPMQSLCRPDCLGLCPVCGKNRNEGVCEHGNA